MGISFGIFYFDAGLFLMRAQGCPYEIDGLPVYLSARAEFNVQVNAPPPEYRNQISVKNRL